MMKRSLALLLAALLIPACGGGGGGGGGGAGGGAVSFKPSPFSLLGPPSGATNIPVLPTFSWTASSTATSYTFELSTSSSFATFVIQQTGIVTTDFTPPAPLAESTLFYWRVWAVNSTGTRLATGAPRSFTTGVLPTPFSLLAPRNGHPGAILLPTFTWAPSSGATSYILQVSTASDFSSLAVYKADLLVTSFTPTTLLNPATAYYWRVFAFNSIGIRFSTGAPWTFTTIAPLPGSFALDRAFNGTVRDFALAADGSGDLYAAGDFSSYDDTLSSMILRINADGTADPGFSTGTGFQGPLAPPGVVYSVAVATDGSGDVYAGGNFISYNGTSRVNLARINADGSLDTGFAVGTGFDGIVRAVAAATDGSGDVYVGGDFANYNGTAAPRIIRLNPDGTVDAGFDVGTGTAGAVHCLEVAADGSGDVYAGGSIPTYRGNASKNLVRINSDGSYDPGFAVGTGFDFIVRSIQNAADASGDLYAAGIFTTYNGSGVNRITRLNSDGSRDLGFAVGTGLNAEVHKVRVAADGSGDALAAGFFTSYDGMAANQVVRINSDGSRDAQLDPGTGVQGRIANDRTIYALAVAADGSGDAWIGGPFTVYNGTGQNRFIRLNADGTVDVTSPQGSAFTGSILTIARTEDGSNDLYVGGGFTIYQGALITRIIRLNADGTPDPAFVVGTGFNNTVDVILPSVDGSGDLYVAGGFSSYQGVSANGIVRLNSDGSRDNGFALGTGFNGNVNALAFAPDGSGDLYVGGSFSSYQGVSANSIVRLNSDGSRDNGFAIGTAFGSGLVMTLAPLIDGSGDLYVGGGFTTYQGSAHTRIVRLNSDGSVEPSFNAGSGFDWTVNGVTLSLDLSGSLYVVGGFLNYQGVSAKALIRLLPSGARDPAFDVGTGFAFGTASNLAVPARDASGDVYVGGTFTDYQGTPVNRIVRLNPDGSIDPGFSVGNGCDIDVNEILPAGDATGTIYAGGAFTRYRTSTRSQFMRVGADGILH